jgi:cardiolipin synthase
LLDSSTWVSVSALLGGVLHFAIGAMVTVHVLLNKRDVPAAIGWIGIGWLAPIVGGLLYIGFGVNRVRRRAQRLKGPRPNPYRQGGRVNSSPDPLEHLKLAIGAITGQDMATGKVAAILQSGDEGYPQMLAAIDGARFSIRLATYIFRADALGEQFIAALAKAHARGVKIRVLIDGFGGGFLVSPAYHRLRRKGVPAARFLHSLMPWKMPFLNLRLHKKSLVVDGEVAFIGGLNIGAENLIATHPKKPVRDCHFRLEGSIVRQIEQEFDDDWAFTTGEAPLEAHAAPPAPTERGAPARVIVSGPDQATDKLDLVLLSAIHAARRSVHVATPYFLPDEQILTALQLAALRGVEVHLVLPAVNNQILVGWAAPPHMRPLLVAGCHVWRSPPPFDHTKLMTVDGEWSLIGSANWDMRSLRLNFELTAEFYEADLANALVRRIGERCVNPISLADIDGRPFLVKLRDAAARLTLPYI